MDHLANFAGSLGSTARWLILLALLAWMAFAWGLSVWADAIRPNAIVLPPNAERRRRLLIRIRAVALPLTVLALLASVLYLVGSLAWSPSQHHGIRPKPGRAIAMIVLLAWSIIQFRHLPKRPSGS